MSDMKMRIFLDGDIFNKYIKFAGDYLDSFAIVFEGNTVHFLNTDPSKIVMISKKLEALDTDDSIYPEEPIKVKVSDMLVSIVKKLGAKGYYMIEYDGGDHLTIGHGSDYENWEEFYRVNINIIGTPEEVDEILDMYEKFIDAKESLSAYRFRIAVEDIQKIVKIASLFDSNVKITACEDEVLIRLISDGKENARKKFRASTVELEKTDDEVSGCSSTMISYTMFKNLKNIPKLTDYYFTIGNEAPLIIDDEMSTFTMVIAPVKE